MSLYENTLSETYASYKLSTKLALDIMVWISKDKISKETWEKTMGIPIATEAKDMSPNKLMRVAELFGSALPSKITFPEEFRKHIGDAIRGREDASVYYEFSSTQSPAQKEKYERHMHFIEALKYIESMTQHLVYNPALVGSGTSSSARQGGDRAMPIEPAHSTREESDVLHATLDELAYEYVQSILSIRDLMQKVWANYVVGKITLRTVYTLNHVGATMIEISSKKLYEKAPKLDTSTQDVKLEYFWKYGVAWILHNAYQNQEVIQAREHHVIARPEWEKLARIGLNNFFSPTVAKWIRYWLEKAANNNRLPRNAGIVVKPILPGTLIKVDNGQELVQDRHPALYQAAWYEDTGRLFIEAYNCLAHLQSSGQEYKLWPSLDALTSETSVAFLESDASKASKTGPIHLHMVLDALYILAAKQFKPYNMTVDLGNSALRGSAEFDSTVAGLSNHFDKTKNIAKSILPSNLHTETWLKQNNPALVGALNFALLEERHSAIVALEKKWPNIVAYLALYNVLRSTKHLPAQHDDAEQLITWYSEETLLGQSPRPLGPETAHECLDRVVREATNTNFFSQPEIEQLTANSITIGNRSAIRGLHHHLMTLTTESQAETSSSHVEPQQNPDQTPSTNAESSSSGITETPRPTNVELLQTLQTRLTEHDQRRAYFDLLSFRNRIMPILQLAADLCKENHYTLTNNYADKPVELVHYAIMFLATMHRHANLGDKMAKQLAKEVQNLINEHGRDELQKAEQLSGLDLKIGLENLKI